MDGRVRTAAAETASVHEMGMAMPAWMLVWKFLITVSTSFDA
jgi:hypothetical protein